VRPLIRDEHKEALMSDWLINYAGALQERLLRPDRELVIADQVAEQLLDLARKIAEGTGEKTNAPLSSYLVGRFAVTRALEGVEPSEAVAEATEVANGLLASA
jgi:hypothetical protein